MSAEPRRSPDTAAWAGVRTILVPPDIVAVRRVSPVRVKKRTPWRRGPDGETTARAGGREWFSDRLFVEARQIHLQAACGTSMTAHASCVIGLVVVLLMQSDQIPLVKVGLPLRMPVLMSMPIAELASPAPRSREQTAPKPVPQPPAAVPPEAASEGAAAPIEAPSSIELDAGTPSSVAGSDGGVEGGVASGVAGGVINGTPASGGLAPGPLRLTSGILPPRKIKDVKPIYPQGVLADRAHGSVIIEATVGIDGLIHDAKVIHSVPLLDHAALDAVRQWEFVPSRLNGVPVAVIITVVVHFAVH